VQDAGRSFSHRRGHALRVTGSQARLFYDAHFPRAYRLSFVAHSSRVPVRVSCMMHDRQACALCRLSKIAAAIAWWRACQCAHASTHSRANRIQAFAKIGIDRFRAFHPNPSTIFSRLESFGLAPRTHTIRAYHVHGYMANVPRPRPSWSRPRCASTGGQWWPSRCRCASVAFSFAFFVSWSPRPRCASYFEGHGLGGGGHGAKFFHLHGLHWWRCRWWPRCGTGGGVGVLPLPVPRPLYGVAVSTVSAVSF